jgi:hypothetical protein
MENTQYRDINYILERRVNLQSEKKGKRMTGAAKEIDLIV